MNTMTLPGMEGLVAEEEVRDWWKPLYRGHRDLWSKVLLALQLMEKSGLPSGKTPRMSLDDKEAVGLYVLDCAERGVTADVVWRKMHAVRRGWRFWPSAGEFGAAFQEHADAERAIIRDPVYVRREGALAVTTRALLAPGQEYWTDPVVAEREILGLPALPAGSKALGSGEAQAPSALVAKVADHHRMDATDDADRNPRP